MLISVASYALGHTTSPDGALAELVGRGSRSTRRYTSRRCCPGRAYRAFEWIWKRQPTILPDLGRSTTTPDALTRCMTQILAGLRGKNRLAPDAVIKVDVTRELRACSHTLPVLRRRGRSTGMP